MSISNTVLKNSHEIKATIIQFFTVKKLSLLIIAATIAVLVLHYSSLTNYPPVFIDEPWYADAAWTWLTDGRNFDSMHAGTRDAVIWPRIGNLPLVASFSIFGLGLFQARLVSWIFGVLLLIAIYAVGRYKFGHLTGLAAAILVSLSPPFLQASHYARPDIMLSVFGLVSYLLILLAHKKNYWWAHLSAGLLISLAFDIHQNAILYAFSAIILYIYFYRLRVLKEKGTWLFVIGSVIGVVYYTLTFVLPDADSFIEYYRFSLALSHQMPLRNLNPIELLQSARDEIGRYHFFENNLDFTLIGAGIMYLAYRRKPTDKYLLIFSASMFIGFTLFVGNKHDIYAILLYPYLVLMVAESLMSLLGDLKSTNVQRVFIGTLLILFIFSGLIRFGRTISSHRQYDYYSITDRIKNVIPAESSVMGLPNWWLGFSDYDYKSSIGLTYAHFLHGKSLEQGFEMIRPDYLILDTGLRGLLVDEGYFNPDGFEIFKLPRSEFFTILEQHAEKVLEFSNPWHGSIQLYKLRWE